MEGELLDTDKLLRSLAAEGDRLILSCQESGGWRARVYVHETTPYSAYLIDSGFHLTANYALRELARQVAEKKATDKSQERGPAQ